MQIETQRTLSRISAVAAWLDENEAALAGVARAQSLKAELQEQRAQIERLALAQEQQGGAASGSVVRKSALLEALGADIVDIARTARVMGRDDASLPDKFRLPASDGEQALVATARLFAANALPLKAEFLSYGMPPNFLDDLDADLSAFETLLGDTQGATQRRMSALSGLDAAIESSGRTISALDAIVRNVLRHNKLALDDWLRAKRLEKVRAHREAPTPPTPTPPNP